MALAVLAADGAASSGPTAAATTTTPTTPSTSSTAVYYATVTLSTTGYGDIVPYSDAARLTNVLLVTPLRVLFLIILVGTTLEVLTERTREEWRLNRWRLQLA